MRIGIGYDIHRLVEGRPLILGGVELESDQGLWGHSDADVLTHAVCDALLGAAGLGDLGRHFPDTDPAYQGISSLSLLAQVGAKLAAQAFRVANIDVVVVLERPRLAAHTGQMAANLATCLGIDPDQVNIKASTNEGVGAVGRGEAISAWATAGLVTASAGPGDRSVKSDQGEER